MYRLAFEAMDENTQKQNPEVYQTYVRASFFYVEQLLFTADRHHAFRFVVRSCRRYETPSPQIPKLNKSPWSYFFLSPLARLAVLPARVLQQLHVHLARGDLDVAHHGAADEDVLHRELLGVVGWILMWGGK